MLLFLLMAVALSGAVVSLLPSWDLPYLLALGLHPLLGIVTALWVVVYMRRRLAGRLGWLALLLPVVVAVAGPLQTQRLDLVLWTVGLAHLGGARLLLGGRTAAGGWLLYLLWNLALASGLAQLACLWRHGDADVARLHLSLGMATVAALGMLFLAARHLPRRALLGGALLAVPLLAGSLVVQGPTPTWSLSLSAQDLSASHISPAVTVPTEAAALDASCAACHGEEVRTHALSAHALSLRTPHMQAVVALATAEVGPEAWRSCAACHAPRALTDPDPSPVILDGMEGMTCLGCHLVREVSADRATLTYALPAHTDLFVDGSGREHHPDRQTIAAIRLSPLRHADAFMAPVLSEDRFCLSCHRDQIDPSPANGLQPIRCVECHMQGRDHTMPGANAALFQFAGAPEATARLRAWIRGEERISLRGWEYLWTVRERLDDAPPRMVWLTLFHEDLSPARPGQAYRFRVQSSNVGAPHAFPAGDLSLSEAWLELRVQDAAGTVLLQTAPGEVRLGGALLDADGVPITHYRVWDATETRTDAVIRGGRHRNDDFTVEIPPDAVGPLTIEGTWRYRKMSLDFARWAYGPDVEVPVVSLGRLSHAVALQ